MAAHDPDHKPEKWTKSEIKFDDEEEEEEETDDEAANDNIQEEGEDGQSYMVLEVRFSFISNLKIIQIF